MLHALTTYFNPAGYTRPRENYARFRDSLRGCTLHTIELSFTGQFEIPDAVHVQGGPENLMWQKERLLNRLVESLPREVEHVAWIDCDLLFCNPDWAEQALQALDELPVVQLFEFVHFLGPHGRIVRSNGSHALVVASRQTAISSPGGAWAARREIFPLIDIGVCGGADKLLAEAWRGRWNATAHKMNTAWAMAYITAGRRQHELVQGQIGHIRGDILHCWHGTRENRRYTERWAYLTDHKFDPETDIAIDAQGLWRWSSDKPQMHAAVARYFEERREDG